MPNPPVEKVSKEKFTQLTNRYGQTGNTPRCPAGCYFTHFRAATKEKTSAFVCHVCKTEIRGS